MFQNIERVKKFSRFSILLAAVLAVLAGVTDLLTPIEAITLTTTWITAGFAFLAAIFGVVTLILDKRKDSLEDALKRAPPSLDVSIKTGQEDQNLYVVIETINLIPFEYNWRIVTRNDRVVSGIMLDWSKVYPDGKQPYYTVPARINLAEVIDDFVELRFEYRSTNFAELHDPNLSGSIIKKYKLSEDRKSAIPLSLNNRNG